MRDRAGYWWSPPPFGMRLSVLLAVRDDRVGDQAGGDAEQ